MGHRHNKDDILEAALAAALDEGLSQLTFGRLAKRIGISDRVIVYYFPTKNDLVTEVMSAVGLELQLALTTAFSSRASDHLELVRAAWPVLSRPDVDPVFALFFEAMGLAAAGREPYRAVVPRLVDAWIEWVTTFIDGTPAHARSQAEATVAVIDGLLLLRQVAGGEAADRAARCLGVDQG